MQVYIFFLRCKTNVDGSQWHRLSLISPPTTSDVSILGASKESFILHMFDLKRQQKKTHKNLSRYSLAGENFNFVPTAAALLLRTRHAVIHPSIHPSVYPALNWWCWV